MKRRNKRPGFTLIELLIVSVLLSIVSLAIYTSFSNGLKVWKRVNTAIDDEDTVLFLERLGAELRGTVLFKAVGFQGTERGFEFPTVIFSKRMNKPVVAKVAYAFDSSAEAITRTVTDPSGLFTGSPGAATTVLAKVRQAKVSFYHHNPVTRLLEWVEGWSLTVPPLAVRVELVRAGGDEQDPVVCTFPIPVSKDTNEHE